MAHYVTREELRKAADDATAQALPDSLADRLIRLAEAIVENALGDRARHTEGPQEGLKIAEADVAPWQWERLKESICAIGAHLYRNPDLVRGIVWDSVSGPDFSRSGGTGAIFGNEGTILFASTGLMPRGARAVP